MRTETDRLTAATRQHLVDAGIGRVEISGGTAAISDAVEAEVRDLGITTERLAGPDRASTATDASRVLLVEGEGPDAWAGGFAAAAHSARLDAPIVLAAGDHELPVGCQLRGGHRRPGRLSRADLRHRPGVCEQARVTLDLSPAIPVTFQPAEGQPVTKGQDVRVTLPGTTAEVVTAHGSCLAEPVEAAVSGGVADVTITAASEGLSSASNVALPNGAVQRRRSPTSPTCPSCRPRPTGRARVGSSPPSPSTGT